VQSTSDPVLLLHGQPGSARDWDQVRAAIGERAPTIAVDRPGWDGRSVAQDLTTNARAALGVLDSAGIERATVAGHSLGGAVAAWLAVEHPERVTALVLAAPSANGASLNRLDELLAIPLVGPLVTAGALTGIGLTLKARPLRRRVAGQLRLEDDYLRAYATALLRPATWRSFAVEQRRLLDDLPALEGRLAEISAPTTIVIGTADRIVSPNSARELARQIPGASLVEFDGAAHLLLQQRPGQLAEVIVEAARGRLPWAS
jgi:pimeloyl-ACP methyl ester carboxylesterase